jgi:hypothetical protein
VDGGFSVGEVWFNACGHISFFTQINFLFFLKKQCNVKTVDIGTIKTVFEIGRYLMGMTAEVGKVTLCDEALSDESL